MLDYVGGSKWREAGALPIPLAGPRASLLGGALHITGNMDGWSPLVCKQGEVIYLIQELVSSRRVLLCTFELISLVST